MYRIIEYTGVTLQRQNVGLSRHDKGLTVMFNVECTLLNVIL